MNAALYIAAKAPHPGLAKTRLSAALGTEAALGLYRGFLHDLAARLLAGGLRPGWYVTPPTAWAEIAACLPAVARPARVLAQPAGDWTARQQALFDLTAHWPRHARLLLIASDSPQVSVAEIAAAAALLDRHDLVLGPVLDGGYWLIGMHGRHDVLRGIQMSTGDVLGRIIARAEQLGLSTGLLEPTFDIDEAADLAQLAAILAVRDDLPATRAAFARLGRGAAVAAG